MQKDPKTQTDNEFETLLLKFINDEDEDNELTDTEDDQENSLPPDDEASDDLPFPREMDDRVADMMMKCGHEGNCITDDILSVDISVLPDAAPGYYCEGPMTVTLRLKTGVRVKSHRYQCFVYNDSFYPMGSSTDGDGMKHRRGNKVTIDVPSSKIWIPGKYILIILDGQESTTLRIDFELDDMLRPVCSPPRECDLFGLETTLVSCIQDTDTNWIEIATMPGTAQMRQKIIEYRQMMLYNELRTYHGGNKMDACSNFLICTLNDDITAYTLRILMEMMLTDGKFKHIDCQTLYDLSRPNPYEPLAEQLDDTFGKVLCLTNLRDLSGTSGKIILRKIIDKVRDGQGNTSLWLCGARRDIDELMNMTPSLRQFFQKDSYIEQERYTAFELVQAFFQQLRNEYLEPGVLTKDHFARAIIKGYSLGNLASWSLDDVRRFVVEDIRPRYVRRTMPLMLDSQVPLLAEEDIDFAKLTSSVTTYDESMQELNEMVGLDDVKKGILTMANQARLFLERRRKGLNTSSDMIFHSIFSGNPGTGKTTVARMLGKIYHSLGLLSKGEVIAVDRTRLVGQYIGQTEENMKMVLDEARGNVLFVDEAYTLSVGGDDRKDFGGRVLDSLLTVLTQPDPDMLIVFAGYTREMDAMLSTNPGLSGRFPYRYQFTDYNADELMEIARRLLDRDEYILTADAETELLACITDALRQKTPNFSNARWVEQLVRNGIIPAMANRIFSTGSQDFQRIEASDVRKAFEKFNPKTIELKPRHRVAGFSA